MQSPSGKYFPTHEMRLPPELCEAIIDQLSPEDRPILQNCALVCRFFALRAQKILFRSISLGRPNRIFRFPIQSLRHPTRQFLSLLNSSPRLSAYVEEVEITDNAHLNFYREELSWIRRDTVLPVVLSRLDNLQRFSIAGNLTGNRLNFRAWSDQLKHTILMKCQSPLLTKISLGFVRNVPVSIFTEAPALESIYLFKSVFILDGMHFSPQRADRPRLKALEVTMTTYYEWTAFYPWLLDEENGLDLTGLVALGLHVDSTPDGGPEGAVECINAIAWAVRQCAATLKHLRLFYPFEVSSSMMAAHPFLDLGTMPNLRSLSLHGSLWTDQMPGESPNRLPWITSTLRQIPPSTPLERVTLLCSVEHDTTAPFAVGDADWAGFIAALEHLCTRAEVFVLVSLFESCGPETKAVVEERLRGLRERGIVSVRRVAESEMFDFND